MATIVVSGALANKLDQGGEAWVRLSWALGLRRLGFDVWLVEQIAPQTCVDARGEPAGFEESANRRYFCEVTRRFGLGDRSAVILGDGPVAAGPEWEELLEVAGGAQLLVNISGHLRSPSLLARFRRRAYVDIDPGYTQMWHDAGGDPVNLDAHHLHFTIAENIGRPECGIPPAGFRWLSTRQPVVLEEWPPIPGGDPHHFTTIASWRNPFGRLEHAGRTYGMKLDEFRRVVELPERAPHHRFELALDIHPDEVSDLERLRDHGWHLTDPRAAAGTPQAFRHYVQRAGSEFSVAQGVYVETKSGWFSDRTARYLASGKPALVQDTGFSRFLPVGEGILPFSDLEEAVAGANAIATDYERHSEAARALAEHYFDSDAILTRFLEDAGVAP